MATKTIPVEQAIGMVLPHDVTEITPEANDCEKPFKGPAFRKGHIIRTEDIEHLKRLGKEHIYVLTLDEDEVHENEAARLMADSLAGQGVIWSGRPSEGKLGLLAEYDGLLSINIDALYQFNLLGEVMCATLHNNTLVDKGEQIGATRLIPLTAKRAIVDQAVNIAETAHGILKVLPLKKVKAGLVITGNEVFHGRIEDRFEPVLREKLTSLGSKVTKVCIAPDDKTQIAAEIQNCLDAGAELIITSGGMSVDPDDVTRAGIEFAGAEDIVYGTPVLPGAMFLSARIGDIPILGLPACGMFHKITVFDLVLPRLLTGQHITREDIAQMGHGGLCRTCKKCHFPVCGFGK